MVKAWREEESSSEQTKCSLQTIRADLSPQMDAPVQPEPAKGVGSKGTASKGTSEAAGGRQHRGTSSAERLPKGLRDGVANHQHHTGRTSSAGVVKQTEQTRLDNMLLFKEMSPKKDSQCKHVFSEFVWHASVNKQI